MTAMSVTLFLLACRLIAKCSSRAKQVSALIVTGCIVLFASVLLDSAWLLMVLPFQAAIIYANWLVPLAAVLAGILWKGTGKAVWRRLLFVVPCLLVAFYFPFRLMTGRTPECANLWWANRVCLQTSQATCSPAAAVTLLKYHDIGASEEEMARLCLTRKNGTYLHGLYRGLRIKTRAAGYRVVVRSTELARLRSGVKLPVILNVKLTEAVNRRDPRYSKDWGWRVGVPHTVVLFRFTDGGRVRIGDPGVGHEHWDLQALRDLWHGEYIALETTK